MAETNEKQNRRIYADYAQVLIKQAIPLYADDPNFSLDIDNMVCVLDSTTIDLCLSLFPHAEFRKTKGAVMMYIVLDLRGLIPIYVNITKYPAELRLVTYEDFTDGNSYHFLTNNFLLDSLTIAELYRELWKIELFFKWIKQHLRIKAFYGTSENAVNCQIRIAICTYLLAAIAKNQLGIPVSLYTFTQT